MSETTDGVERTAELVRLLDIETLDVAPLAEEGRGRSRRGRRGGRSRARWSDEDDAAGVAGSVVPGSAWRGAGGA